MELWSTIAVKVSRRGGEGRGRGKEGERWKGGKGREGGKEGERGRVTEWRRIWLFLFSCFRLNFRRGQQTGPLLTSSDFSSHSAAPDSRGLDEGGVVRPYIRKRKKLNSSVD